MAATDVNFTQKPLNTREKFLKMAERQLPFGQLPLLQIDGLEIVQSQAIVRYLARRAKLQGTTAEEEVKCDMIAEAIRDLISLAAAAPFRRKESPEAAQKHVQLMREKWAFVGGRMEAVLHTNNRYALV